MRKNIRSLGRLSRRPRGMTLGQAQPVDLQLRVGAGLDAAAALLLLQVLRASRGDDFKLADLGAAELLAIADAVGDQAETSQGQAERLVQFSLVTESAAVCAFDELIAGWLDIAADDVVEHGGVLQFSGCGWCVQMIALPAVAQ